MNSIKCVVSICWVVYCQSTQLGYLFSSFPNLIYLILLHLKGDVTVNFCDHQNLFLLQLLHFICFHVVTISRLLCNSMSWCWLFVSPSSQFKSQPRLVNIQFVAGAGSRFVVFTQIRF